MSEKISLDSSDLINQNLLSTFWENIYQKQLLFT